MEQNTDRMGFALIALSIVAVVLIIMNTIFLPTIKSYFQGLQKWSDNVMNQLNPPQQYTHTAYAWSSDGSDRFTTTKPNYNLLNKTNSYSNDGYNNDGYLDANNNVATWSVINVFDLYQNRTVKGVSVLSKDAESKYFSSGIRVTGPTYSPGTYKRGDKITVSYYVKNKGLKPFYMNNAFGGYVIGSGTQTNLVDTFTELIPSDGKWHYIKKTYELNTDLSTVLGYLYGQVTTASGQISFDATQLKLERGSIATPYMLSESEATAADQPTYIGTYTDTNEQGSQDPSKYTWTKTN